MPNPLQSIVKNMLRSVVRRQEHYDAIEGVARRADSWLNVVTGIGSRLVDKVTHTQPKAFRRLSDSACTALFHGDATSRKACELRPKTALRRGVTFTLPKDKGGAELSTEVMDEIERLDAINRFKLASTWEACYGGCLLWVGLDDGYYGEDSQELPVDMTRINKVLFIREVDRRYCYPDYDFDSIEFDPMSPNFSEPTHYNVMAGDRSTMVRVHRDRLIVFPGMTTSVDVRQSWNGWGVSVLDVAWAALQRNGMIWGSSANMIANSQYNVLKLGGFAKIVTGKDGEEQAKRRASAMEMAKSMINAIIIDKDDDYIRENPDFGNLPEMIDRFMCDVAHHLDIPVTKLFGRSPAGMNSTGESDDDNWDESVEDFQQHHLRMRFHRLCELIVAQKDGPFGGKDPGGWKVSFPPLKQMSDVEKSDVYSKTAHADEIYINAGVMTPNECAQSRFRAEGYSTETTIDLEMRERLAEGDEDELVAKAKAAVALHEANADNPLGVQPDDGAGAKPGAKKKPAGKTAKE